MKFEWKYGENDCQKYYDVNVNGTWICVFANKLYPDKWMAIINNRLIYNRTKNNRMRKKGIFNKSFILYGDTPEYMMKKAEWCYTHNLEEISQ
jgi:hypothetical protein